MGAPLVEGRDLLVEDDQVYMRTASPSAPNSRPGTKKCAGAKRT